MLWIKIIFIFGLFIAAFCFLTTNVYAFDNMAALQHPIYEKIENTFRLPKLENTPRLPKLDIHGYYHIRGYRDRIRDDSRERINELRQNFRLEFSQGLPKKLKLFVSLDGKYNIAGTSKNKFETEEMKLQLWESYINYNSGNLSLRIGKQAIRWGKGDEVNPTDNFTPEDLTEYLNFPRAERKMPVWMVKADYSFSPSPYRAELVWLPFFVPSRLPEAGSDWESYILREYHSSPLHNVVRPQRPKPSLKNQVVAAKITRTMPNYILHLH